MAYTKKPKFSYSKLNTYSSCGWKYYLTYITGHYVFTDSLASELGTLLHHTEEEIAKSLKAGETPNYEQLKKDFAELNIPKAFPGDNKGGIYGTNILKERYKEEYFKPNAEGVSYFTKVADYLTHGIYRLEEFLSANPNLLIFDMEKYFAVDYKGHLLSGFIDRIFYDTETEEYIIEDIKTKGKLFSDQDLATPMQFVVYVYALAQTLGISEDKIKCVYDLPFCDMKQPAGTANFMKRGLKKLDSIFEGIETEDYAPAPSPLCHWCPFCPTNPEQTEEGKYLCPYYSLWTREDKTHAVANKWQGMEKHSEIMREEKEKQLAAAADSQDKKTDFDF